MCAKQHGKYRTGKTKFFAYSRVPHFSPEMLPTTASPDDAVRHFSPMPSGMPPKHTNNDSENNAQTDEVVRHFSLEMLPTTASTDEAVRHFTPMPSGTPPK